VLHALCPLVSQFKYIGCQAFPLISLLKVPLCEGDLGPHVMHGLLQQNSAVFKWGRWLTQPVLYNGCKTVIVMVMVVMVLFINIGTARIVCAAESV